MLAFDLAKVYGTETKRINEVIRNNLRLNISTSSDSSNNSFHNN